MEAQNKRSFGGFGEKLATGFLEKNNYKILAVNYQVGRLGEIDIIARENEYICFVEVKTRKSLIYGNPSEAITKRKQYTIRKLASIYLDRNKLNEANARFDVVEIVYGGQENYDINLIRNAF